MFTQMLSWSLEGIKVLNMVNRIKQTEGSLSSWKHQPHSLHSSCLLKALWPPKNNTSLIPPFFPSLQKSRHKGSQSCHGRRKTFQALSSVLWDAHFHLYVFRMGSRDRLPIVGWQFILRTILQWKQGEQFMGICTSPNSPVTIPLSPFLL